MISFYPSDFDMPDIVFPLETFPYWMPNKNFWHFLSVSVDTAIANANVPDDDTVGEGLGFINIHYFAAAATRWGGIAKGGYQYEGKSYDAKFAHVEGLDTCNSCHDPHSLEIQVDTCSVCHGGVNSREALKDIRLVGSASDYDGDGNISEGLSGEIETLQEKLLVMIRLYAAATDGVEWIEYNGRFVTEDQEDYTTWTPRLLQAAYNYQYVAKDPGSYSHNPKYIMQLLYDSINDLGGDTRGMKRP